MPTYKVFCGWRTCSWRGTYDQLLVAPHPFRRDTEEVTGCPRCKEIEIEIEACAHDECWERATCGQRRPAERFREPGKVYRRTCGKHATKE